MLTQPQNDLLTGTGPGTAMGELMRRYWQPVALTEELPPGGPPLPLRVMGEDQVLFRDEQGRPGLLALHCSHRGADLSYGRCEDGGLRCLYHGWLYDIHGNCLEQPGEAPGSRFQEKIRHPAYVCREKAGFIFAYLGPGDPPELPTYPFMEGPEENSFVTKIYHGCNYLQGNEGNFDLSHLSFLHRFFVELPEKRFGSLDRTLASREGRLSLITLYGRDTAPRVEVEEADYGLRILAIRKVSDDEQYVRVTCFMYPNGFVVPTTPGAIDGGWHVPIDDTSHWKFQLSLSPVPLDKDKARQEMRRFMTPDYSMVQDRSNRYLQDREQMRTVSFSGMGFSFQAQDNWATEGQGPIQDRTREHLGPSDRAIIVVRRLLLSAVRTVQEGKEPPHLVRDPSHNRFGHMLTTQMIVPADADVEGLLKVAVP